MISEPASRDALQDQMNADLKLMQLVLAALTAEASAETQRHVAQVLQEVRGAPAPAGTPERTAALMRDSAMRLADLIVNARAARGLTPGA
ncbi:hypothetical protein [Roseomonas populi]|uniref:Uncharacterized protein n=1 Tax=Roseomonas populi TaxID=3121582 RepID=A0ABT1X9H7_9PROT|nr:hypothetical protein [Roseomonas pecuniae]MCR0984750.1 hypothetical protein [Roseomonas pecuniae]